MLSSSQPLSVVEPIGSASDMTRPGTERSGGPTRRKRGADVLIYHPRLVQAGLDLIDFRQSFGLRPSSLSFK